MDIKNNILVNAKDFLKKFWDKVAHEHSSTTTFDYEVFKNIVNNTNAAILDIGCGYGRFCAICMHLVTKTLLVLIFPRKCWKEAKENHLI